MNTFTSTIEIDQEHTDALQQTVNEVNARLPDGATPWTVETFLADQNKVYAEGRAAHYYALALQRFGDGFKVADYATRKAVMADLETKLPQ